MFRSKLLRTVVQASQTNVALKTRLPTILPRQSRSFASGHGLGKPEIEQRILGVLRGFDKVDAAKITPEANFITDLGLDSLDTVEVTMALEEEFNIEFSDEDAENIYTIKQAVDKIAGSYPHAV